MTSICIDGFNLALSRGTGIATYGRNLLAAAQTLGFETQILFGPEGRIGSNGLLNEANIAGAARTSPLRPSQRLEQKLRIFFSQFGRNAYYSRPQGEVIWPGGETPAEGLWAASALFRYAHRCHRSYGRFTPVRFDASVPRPSFMHWTSPLPLYAKNTPNFYTIHDLIPLRLPHSTLHDRNKFYELHKSIADRADRIIVVSKTTKQDVIRILGVNEDRIINTYQAVSIPENLTQKSDVEVANEIDTIFNLQWKGYFLHFGAIEPKKNLGRLSEAFLTSGSNTPLVIIGAPGWLDKPETSLIDQIGQTNRPISNLIRRHEYTSLPLLISLIRGAKAVLFPSLYEGFGLPVLEAMSLSTAVMTSNYGALAEIAGEAAHLVDPQDVASIRSGIRTLDNDPALVAHLEAQGLVQAERFSINRYRERLAVAYGQAQL